MRAAAGFQSGRALAADEEDAVADELERLRGLGAAPQLADEPRVVDRDAGAAGQLLRQVEIVLVETIGAP